MASYTQIAQQSFASRREDGTTRQWQFSFEKKDGTAQGYNIPLSGDVEIKEGDRSDAPNKPFKTHTVSFTLAGKDEPLINEVYNAGTREIRVTITDTATGIEYFKGYVLNELMDSDLYEPVLEIPVTCYGAIADLEETLVTPFNDFVTIHELGNKIDTAIDLVRELDVYTNLYHQNRAAGDPFPTDISFNEEEMSGGNTGTTLLTVTKRVMTALGLQLFQRRGRLVMADLYDRFADSASIGKHQGDGAGGYTHTTANVELSLDENNIVRGGNLKQLAPVKQYEHRYTMTHRQASEFTDPSPVNHSQGSEADRAMTYGIVRGNDIITVGAITGYLETTGPTNNVSGSVEYARIELRDSVSGTTYYYNPSGVGSWVTSPAGFSESFSFTGGGGVQQQAFSVSNLDLPAAPKGVVAELVLVTSNYLTITTGSALDVEDTYFTNLDISIVFADPDLGATHQFNSYSTESAGNIIQATTYGGDIDLQSPDHSFLYNNSGTRESTFNWISATGNGRLGKVIADRIGAIVLGRGQEFTIEIRDTINVDLLTVIKIADNDGNIVTCLPKEIRRNLFSGFIRIRLLEVFDGLATADDHYIGPV